ncbi:MAG TPA: methyltransferase domain-containing protein [Candidatus Omnitrophota bacterium]|nr:methyltransferase domain-containing protein [Candidatus Omnitrophota bacterium]
MQIANTGERILLEKETPIFIARHFCAYKFAKGYAQGMDVLDIACGEGYGSYFLADFALMVTGIDYDPEVIGYAKEKYKRDNLEFLTLDINALGSLKKKFNLICSFQFIEHLKDAKAFLTSIKGNLSESGIFICSTPNKYDASPNSDAPLNKFHLKEYTLLEFRELLEAGFKEVRIWGLKRTRRQRFYRRLKKIGLFNFLPHSLNPVERFFASAGCEDFAIIKDVLDSALDFIAVCRN